MDDQRANRDGGRLQLKRFLPRIALLIVFGTVIGIVIGVGRMLVERLFGISNESWWADTGRITGNVIAALFLYEVYMSWPRRQLTENNFPTT
jgi:hypothetical protein